MKKAYKYIIRCERDKSFAPSKQMKSPEEVSAFVKEYLYSDDLALYESMFMLILNNQGYIKG